MDPLMQRCSAYVKQATGTKMPIDVWGPVLEILVLDSEFRGQNDAERQFEVDSWISRNETLLK